jgi:hypothetical protein
MRMARSPEIPTIILKYKACPQATEVLKREIVRYGFKKGDDALFDGWNSPNRNCAGWVCELLRKAENHMDPTNLPKTKVFLPIKYIYAPSTEPTRICGTRGMMPYHLVPGGERIPLITSQDHFEEYRPLTDNQYSTYMLNH